MHQVPTKGPEPIQVVEDVTVGTWPSRLEGMLRGTEGLGSGALPVSSVEASGGRPGLTAESVSL